MFNYFIIFLNLSDKSDARRHTHGWQADRSFPHTPFHLIFLLFSFLVSHLHVYLFKLYQQLYFHHAYNVLLLLLIRKLMMIWKRAWKTRKMNMKGTRMLLVPFCVLNKSLMDMRKVKWEVCMGRWFFWTTTNFFNLEPNIVHYLCFILLFGI